MLSKCKRVVYMIFTYAPLSSILYVLSNIIVALVTTFNIFITERLVNGIENMICSNGSLAYVMLFCSLMIMSNIFLHINAHCRTIAELSISRRLNGRFLETIVSKLRKLKYSCFENSTCMDYIRFVSEESDEKLKLCFTKIVVAITSACSLIGILIYFISISFGIALIYFATVSLTIYVSLNAAEWYDTFIMANCEDERKAEYLNRLIIEKDSLFELKIFDSVHYIVSKWKKLIDSILNQKIKLMVKKEKYYFFSLALMTIYSFLTIVYISTKIISGQFRLGLLVAFISAVGTIFIIADQFADSLYELKIALNDIKNYEMFMQLPEIFQGEVNEVPDNPDILFENVSFTYPGTKEEVLHNINFKISAGEKIAIVGENGAGKSTLIKLMLGLYSPTCGKISVGGIALEQFSQEVKKRLFSAVFQDYAQYEISVVENIALAEENTQDIYEEAENALRMVDVQLSHMIGMNTMLGKLEDEGIELSKGQWQKIAIARGLVANSSYLVLDEPVASLDPLSESSLYKDFLDAAEQKEGTIIVSHRLASARLCSRILVIKNGRIEEEGAHDDLIAKNGEYAFMYQSQANWYNENE